MRTPIVAHTLGVTERQLDYLSRQRILGPPGCGSGCKRRWSNDEVRRLAAAVALCRAAPAGALDLPIAARAAAAGPPPPAAACTVRLSPEGEIAYDPPATGPGVYAWLPSAEASASGRSFA